MSDYFDTPTDFEDFSGGYEEEPTGNWGGYESEYINPIEYDSGANYSFDNMPSMSGVDSWQTPQWTTGEDGTQFWKDQMGQNVGYMPQGGQFTPYNYSNQGGLGDQLSNLFGGATNGLNKILPALTAGVAGQQRSSESQMAPWLKLLGLGGAAMMERKGQQQMSQAAPQAVSQIAQRADPFAAERARYMQELQGSQDRLNQFRQDPNSNAQYAALRDAAMHRIDRLGAKQGQRFAPQATNPALVEALTNSQMQIDKQMQADRQGLYQPSGANVNPWSGGLEALLQGNKYGAQADSYSSLFNALGYGMNANQNGTNQGETMRRMQEFLNQQGV